MAQPRRHTELSIPFLILSVLFLPRTNEFWITNLIAIIFLGVFIDIDHLSPRRLCKITGKKCTTADNRLIWWLVTFYQAIVIMFRVYILREKKKGEKGRIPGWINYFHTWQAAAILTGAGIIISVWYRPFILSLAAYWLHIWIDAFKRVIHLDNSPLPKYLSRFIPEKWKYDIVLEI